MKRAFLVIDNQPGFAGLLKNIVEREWDSMRVDTYDPTDWGWPEDVDWKHYSIVFIASRMGEDDGLEWLEILRNKPDFPSCIILGNSGEPSELDVRCKDLGAVDYLRKSMLTRKRIVDAVRAVIQKNKKSAKPAPQQPGSSPELEEFNLAPLDDVPVTSAAELTSGPVPSMGSNTAGLSLQPQEELRADLLGIQETPAAAEKTEPAKVLVPEDKNPTGDTKETSPDNSASLEKLVEQSIKGPAMQNSKLRVDGYVIEKKIAEGGMSGIYLCTREEDGKPAVLKTILPRVEEAKKLRAVERADLEFSVISRIHHNNVVRLYDHGRANDIVYTTMEYFDTGDLKQRMQQGITQQQALSYMVQVAEGLNAIHGSGIIHRDLKPANIMFRQNDTLAILDFGIAKDITRKLDLTLKGMRLGTPSYMSPEQGNGGYKLDARSDLYSLGVMLYEMLSKQRPYRGRAAEVIKSHLYDPIPQLPQEFFEVQVIIDRLMGKFPHNRFESAYDLTQFIRANYRYDTTLNFDFDPEGDFLTLEKDKNAHF